MYVTSMHSTVEIMKHETAFNVAPERVPNLKSSESMNWWQTSSINKLAIVHPIMLPTEPLEYKIKVEPRVNSTISGLKSPKFHGTKL